MGYELGITIALLLDVALITIVGKDEMREPMEIYEIVEAITGLFPEDLERSGKPREYFEEKMLERLRWGHLNDDQYVLVWSVVKAILDRTYPS